MYTAIPAFKRIITAFCIIITGLIAFSSCFVFRDSGCDCPAYSDGSLEKGTDAGIDGGQSAEDILEINPVLTDGENGK